MNAAVGIIDARELLDDLLRNIWERKEEPEDTKRQQKKENVQLCDVKGSTECAVIGFHLC